MQHYIHDTSIISSSAVIGRDVKIGPFCIIGDEVILEEGVELKSHVVIEARTTIGSNTVIYPFASIGQPPQILKYEGERSKTIIGSNNTIREYVTIQAGSKDGGMLTSVGDNCLFMVGAHVAHDCILGNNIILANYVSLAGHVEVGDYVVIGGLSAVHQYARIGKHAMIGGMSALARDLIPFGVATNERAYLEGLNLIGMKRRGFDRQESLDAIKAIDEIFIGEGVLSDRIMNLSDKYKNNSIVEEIIEFLQYDSSRSFCAPKKS
jgi:UDP-N-acetylglucosamine acyltransferase